MKTARSKLLTLATAAVLVALSDPVSAGFNENTTIQEGVFNANSSYQRGRVNTNESWQLGRKNANRTMQFGRSNYNETFQSRDFRKTGAARRGQERGRRR